MVVDNGSSDGTVQVARSEAPVNLRPRIVTEPRPGLSNARNTGVYAANGDVIVFTDDDVRPRSAWIESMCRPIVKGEADAVGGWISLPSHLERSWMTPRHKFWLAARDRHDLRQRLVGANMSFSRRVLKRVPAFDPELGPGGLGYADDTLFAEQLIAAGFRIQVGAPETAVEHHFQSERLLHTAWVEAARKRGRSKAYVAYHWRHETLNRLALRRAYTRLKLWIEQHPNQARSSNEGISKREFYLLQRIAFLQHLSELQGTPLRYQRRGLVKIQIQNGP